jgi:hypothetical protein
MERGSADTFEIKYERLGSRPNIKAAANCNLLLRVISRLLSVHLLLLLELSNLPLFLTFSDCNVCEELDVFYVALFYAAP